ncbi:hypothetical protein HMPREF6485_0776, partial [Segatella buccae ATCC 33574]
MFGPSGKIDGAERADRTNVFGNPKDRSAFGCKAFSKDLIVCAICGLSIQETPETPLRDPQPPKGGFAIHLFAG